MEENSIDSLYQTFYQKIARVSTSNKGASQQPNYRSKAISELMPSICSRWEEKAKKLSRLRTCPTVFWRSMESRLDTITEFRYGCSDCCISIGGRMRLSVDSTPGYRGTAFQAAVCDACVRGLHHRLSRYRLPDGWLGGVLVRGLHPRLLRYCLPDSRVWCVYPGAPPPVIEIPSSRRQCVMLVSGGFTHGY